MPPSPPLSEDRLHVPGFWPMGAVGLILGALAVGRTSIRGLAAESEITALAAALRALGAQVLQHDDGLWTVDGVGIGGLREPASVLDAGASATVAALLIGLVATHPVTAIVGGTRAAPLLPLLHPLERMGASFTGRQGGLLPLAVTGAGVPMPIDHVLPSGAGETKVALLLAALNVPGTTSLIDPSGQPDPVEGLFAAFGAALRAETSAGDGRRLSIDGQPELVPAALDLAMILTGTV
jgi:3-phosphoshikimate 1-carboxyvinyltransferase